MAQEATREDTSLAEYRKAAERLMDCVDAGDTVAAQGVIDDLTHLRETELFRELGTLTRDLHEAIKTFHLDDRLADITSQEIPDARERLNYVITMTDQAAHRTLNVIEDSMPLAQELSTESCRLLEQWQRFRRRELSADEFRRLSREVQGYFEKVRDNGQLMHNKLSEALMAQDYQDLTGQIIRKVIALVEEVEGNLVHLIRISGQRIVEERAGGGVDAAKEREAMMRGQGPSIPGGDAGDVVASQDDVDDLLSSLGF